MGFCFDDRQRLLWRIDRDRGPYPALDLLVFVHVLFLEHRVRAVGGVVSGHRKRGDPGIKGKIQFAQVMTVISWCTYPIVYLFPMLGITASKAVVGIQIGYCVSDIISKCGVGLVIYQVSYAKSNKDGALLG